VLSLAVDVRAPAAFAISYGSGGRSAVEPDQLLEMLLEKSGDGMYGWTINGRSYPTIEPLLLQQGRRYRLRIMNATGGAHSVSLRHHSFEVTRIHQVPVSGIYKDTLSLERYNVVEADVLMSRSGPLLLHYASC
jgi:FtsP/CotA-like multicopper oxidase with cupredoxin domain